ncbi:hypothetical protein BGZ49_005498 [Haplosporangium sp. Z 27]|nr:hypothetical protein BGZ49_005498 [Haplosporangium sp. Z 27]
MLVVSNSTVNLYNIQTGKWNKTLSINNYSNIQGLTAATDPSTGLIYIPNGYRSSPNTTTMLQLDTTQGSTTSLPMPPNLANLTAFSAVWSVAQQSMFIFGGSSTSSSNFKLNLFSYNPQTAWSLVLTSGQAPSARTLSCMLPVDGGSKLVLFGGFGLVPGKGQMSLNDIYILDTTSKVWTRGADAAPEDARGAMACGVSNNQFIAWGGANNASAALNSTIIYDLKANAWISGYTAPPPPPKTSSSTPGSVPSAGSSAASSSQTGPSMIIILGAVVGFLILCAIVGTLLYRRSKRRAAPKKDEKPAFRADAWISGPLDADKPQTSSSSPYHNHIPPWIREHLCPSVTPSESALASERTLVSDRAPRTPSPAHTTDSSKKWRDHEDGYNGRLAPSPNIFASSKKWHDHEEGYGEHGNYSPIRNSATARKWRDHEEGYEQDEVPKPSSRARLSNQSRKPMTPLPMTPLPINESPEPHQRQPRFNTATTTTTNIPKRSRPERTVNPTLTDNILEAYTFPESFLPPVDHHGNPIKPAVPQQPSNHTPTSINTRPSHFSFYSDPNDIL